ncbi:MAG: hypothetical protein HY730_01320 [Candidatus Tectomicrobia bacterium]|uniref:DNA-directed RNA polymerase n=1 Tax=Tectimicrobiota bacterium TaxID=2528274 RepID=A0A933GK15_UNCTE|nr:hypothetical protein [Candidatus Tectomicrobia bacterium]
MSASMVDKQLQSPAVNNGQDFYRHTPSHDGTAETGPDVEAMDTAVASLAKAIQDEQQQLMQKSTAPRRRLPMYALPLLCLDASKLAHITLESIQTLITTRGAAGSETMCIHAAKVIGERCQRERRLDLRRGQARDIGKLLMERTNIRSRTKKQAARFDSTDWSEGYRDIHLGAKLIDLAVVYTHMLSIGWGRSRGTRRQPKIPRILRLLEHKLLPLAMPQPLPMTMKPVPWTGLGSGGYPGTEELEMELVKHRHSESAIRALKKAKLAEVFSAVNALQETPWQINKSIYSIVQRLWQEGKKIPGLPPFEPVLPKAAEQGRALSQQNPRVLLVSRLKRYGEAALQGTRRREYVTARACVGLLQALERHSVLPNDNLAEQVSKCLDLPETEYAKDVPDHPLPSERPAPVLNRLLEYRLYEDFRLGWRITLPNLERCGLVRVDYCNLFAICQNNDLWKENMLLKECTLEQRQQIAVGVLDYMRRSLAIDAEYPPQLKRLVRGTLKEPWTFGKKERLFTATVFIDPEVRAEWAKNEKSVSYRSWIGRFLCRQVKWRYPGCLTEEIYTGLIRGLLEALEVGGILKRVNSASGKLGFQIRVDRLQWVRGDGSPPLTSILWFPSKANRVEESKPVADLTIMHLLMAVCEKLFSEDHFFFPHQLDYRGRAYPIPPILNPQSDDLGRALLVFADGKLLGNKGADWLAVHLANMFGYDKASFDDRVKWVHDNQDKILEFVAQPEKISQIWGDARIDKPWCFLAACLEWKGYLKKGKSYKSHLPIAMDGTCNGLQHLSAMGHDPVGSRYTNLVPGSKPEDIYQEVANRLKELVCFLQV